jgi:hypothetical protein
LSCAINWVFTVPPARRELDVCPTTCPVSICQIVQVVSMLDVPMRLASTSFQSNDVNGAQKSELRF